jgi:hypothetical protein
MGPEHVNINRFAISQCTKRYATEVFMIALLINIADNDMTMKVKDTSCATTTKDKKI